MADPSERPAEPLSAKDFIAWALATEADAELIDGRVVFMASERVAHAQARDVARAELDRAVRRAGASCATYSDSLSVRSDDRTVFVPDVMLWCGSRLDRRTVFVDDAVMLVEVISDDSAARDTNRKLRAYGRLPSFQAYLIVFPEDAMGWLHTPTDEGAFLTRIVRAGEPCPLRLDPPGLELDIGAMILPPEPEDAAEA
jgi:Uma2 family endonuclease